MIDADRNFTDAVGCRYLSKGDWPELEKLNLCTDMRTQIKTACERKGASGLPRPPPGREKSSLT
jgi:hypothetical protein